MATETKNTNHDAVSVTCPNEDAIIGIDQALSHYERMLEGVSEKSAPDLYLCLRAAQAWLNAVQSAIHVDDVKNDR